MGRKIFLFRISWGLPKPCGCHVALVSVGLGPMYLESVHMGGLSVYYGGPSVM